MSLEAMAKEGPPQISEYRYNQAIDHMTLLRVMGEVTNGEVRRLISQLKSPDPENWTMAEEVIKNKLSIDNK